MTWFKEAIERRTVSPYQITAVAVQTTMEGALFSSGVEVGHTKLESFKLHRNKVVDAGAQWSVFHTEQDWDHAALDLQLRIPEPEIFADISCRFGVHALCKKTRWRKAEVCDFHPDGASLSLVIPKADVAGEVIVSPFILHAGEDSFKGQRLAGGFPLSLMIDPPGERFGAGMEIHWYPFPEDQRDSLFYLDLDGESPLLLINKSHAGLKHIFEDRSKSGHRYRLRNALFSFIAVDVWSQMAQFAGEIARLEIDDDQDPKVALSRKIVRSLMRMLKLREDEILNTTHDPAERSRLHRLLQHHFKLAGHQDALVSAFLEGPAE